MTKDEAIRHIESLWPQDSEYKDTQEIGQYLLDIAKEECGLSWRDEPESVLIRYAELCLERESVAGKAK